MAGVAAAMNVLESHSLKTDSRIGLAKMEALLNTVLGAPAARARLQRPAAERGEGAWGLGWARSRARVCVAGGRAPASRRLRCQAPKTWP